MGRKRTRDTSVDKRFAHVSIIEMKKGLKKGIHPSTAKAFKKEIRNRRRRR